jgi:hypothetical protein
MIAIREIMEASVTTLDRLVGAMGKEPTISIV